MLNIQCRAAGLEVRAKGRRLEGYAAMFDQVAVIGDFREVIRPGAFSSTLRRRADVLALVDHDPGRLLARTRSGSLRLAEDATGLAFNLDVPDTQLGHDILALADRRDVGGMSFGFRVPPGGDTWDAGLRELRTVDLAEISIVQAWPAYDGTSVQARADRPRPRSVELANHRLRLMRLA